MSICGRPSEEGDGEERNLEGKTRLWGKERCEMRLKITMVVALMVMLMVGVTGVCYAHNWTLLTTSSIGDKDTMGIAGVTGYADLDNVKIDRGKHTIQFWTKIVYLDNSSGVDLNLVDYMYRKRTILQSAGYDINGKFSRFYKLPGYAAIIWPGSFFEDILKPVLLKYGLLHVYGRTPWTP